MLVYTEVLGDCGDMINCMFNGLFCNTLRGGVCESLKQDSIQLMCELVPI